MKKCSTTEETYTVIEKKGQSINIERESDMQENINFMNEDRRYILFAFKWILNKEMLIYFKNLNLSK